MYKKKKLAKKKHRKNKLRLKAKIQESLLKAKPKKAKVAPQVDSVETKVVKEAPTKKVAAKKAPAKKKAAAKKAPAKKAAAKKAPAKKAAAKKAPAKKKTSEKK